MYFKNDSIFQCGLRTKTKILTIKPGDVVQILDSDIIELNPVLVEISEEEFKKAKKAEKKEKVEATTDDIKDAVEIVDAPQPVTIPETELKDEPNEDVKDEVKEDVKNDKPSKPAKLNDLEKLETKLEDLKQKWQEADKASKKAQIQKKIKEVQEQINKLGN